MADLLRRAAELQADADERTHSLAEIQQAAAEVGLDPSMIAQLAAQPVAAAYPWPRFLGPRPSVESTTMAPTAAEIPVADIVNAIRSATGHVGDVQQMGSGVEWRQANDYSVLRVSVTPTSAGTAIRVAGEYKWRLIALAGACGFGGAVAGAMTAVAALAPTPPSTALAVSASLGGAVVGLGGARVVWQLMMQRARNRLLVVQSRIHEMLARASTQ